jgi:hypothetical protein
MRIRIHKTMSHLRAYYRQALKDDLLQEAFDKTWKTWDNETGAMTYARVVSTYDLLNLTSVLSNRRELELLKHRIEALEIPEPNTNTQHKT